jgi:hypothetical protein
MYGGYKDSIRMNKAEDFLICGFLSGLTCKELGSHHYSTHNKKKKQQAN